MNSQLQALYNKLSPVFGKASRHFSGLYSLKITIADLSFELLVDDEYEDLKIDNPLLHFYMMLRTLEIYKDSTDYLDWCKENNVDLSRELRTYYWDLADILILIENKIGPIDSFISDLDYQLGSGDMAVLRAKV